MLRASEKAELNQLVRLRRQKNRLISRLTVEKEEAKMRALEEEILRQTQNGERRARMLPNL